jgi:hypothetical protein
LQHIGVQDLVILVFPACGIITDPRDKSVVVVFLFESDVTILIMTNPFPGFKAALELSPRLDDW